MLERHTVHTRKGALSQKLTFFFLSFSFFVFSGSLTLPIARTCRAGLLQRGQWHSESARLLKYQLQIASNNVFYAVMLTSFML